MIDLIVLALFALLLWRGWSRGFIREVMDLAGLILATLLAFRLGAVAGRVVAGMAGISPEASRLVGGVIVFVVVGLGTRLAARLIESRIRLPGLNAMNRVGGAGLAVAWGVFLATLVLSLAVVLPVPPAVADQLDDSAVARSLTDPDGLPQQVFNQLSGDRIIEALLNLRHLAGSRRVVLEEDQVVTFPPVEADDLEADGAAAQEILDLLNLARIDAGVDPLAWTPALAEVGYGHAVEMYVEGYFAHFSPETGYLKDRLRAAGLIYVFAGENLALAPTPEEVHQGLIESPGHRENMLSPEFRRVGIAVVSGPLGLMTAQVFTG
ncbi:MAG: CvpA family protein [Acidimicrobiia bacterium]